MTFTVAAIASCNLFTEHSIGTDSKFRRQDQIYDNGISYNDEALGFYFWF